MDEPEVNKCIYRLILFYFYLHVSSLKANVQWLDGWLD